MNQSKEGQMKKEINKIPQAIQIAIISCLFTAKGNSNRISHNKFQLDW